MFYLSLIVCFLCSLMITPIVKKLAYKMGATDNPNHRKVHTKIMPRMGGLAIFISFLVGIILLQPEHAYHLSIVLGSIIIITIGVLDDKYELSAKVKTLGQLAAALIVVFYGGLDIDFINLPFGGRVDFGALNIPFTILWIMGVTNAINLIDGLDGLAGGVSSIALISIAGMAFLKGDIYVLTISLILLVSTLGFLPYNFYPAKIFMGDTGALFLGFMISVLSMMGFKNVTFISFIIPIFILGVPLSDTFFAIIRRIVHKQPISKPDKSHLHHCLLRLGFTHRQTVLMIYAISAMFGLVAFIFSMTTIWGSFVMLLLVLFGLEILAEKIGLVSKKYQPLLKLFKPDKEN
ncbi:MAG: glycosyltransferase family 4 protein [Heyndrickxia sp.]